MCDDSADTGRGGPTGKKEASSSKTVADGKLVKGRLLPVPPSQTGGQVRGSLLLAGCCHRAPYLVVLSSLGCGAIWI